MKMNGALLLLVLPVLPMASLAGAASRVPASGAGEETPAIGIIDFYGLRDVSAEQARRSLGIKEGDPVPASTRDLEERLSRIPDVVRARISFVCCEAGRMILYAGIAEIDHPGFSLRAAPTSEVSLPEEIVDAYRRFMQALEDAARKGDASEDVSRGHSLMSNPACRSLQERFIDYAASKRENLHDVLRNSSDAGHRAIAAYVLGYASDKSQVLDDLYLGMRDPDDTTRNNATRALGAIAALATRRPDLGIRLWAEPFIEMLDSISWTDRNKSLMALTSLTARRDPAILERLRVRALPSLAEMARWKSESHALPAYFILGRVTGIPEKEIEESWRKGAREALIARALSSTHEPTRQVPWPPSPS